MNLKRRTQKTLLGLTAGLLTGRRLTRRPITPKDLQKHHFPSSAQRLGIAFTEEIRNAFRLRWLRKSR